MDAYKTWIFDCDGVLLDSNHIKSEAFYEVALSYGKDNADTFLKYHRDFGGVSRYEKFNYFFKCILRKTDYSDELFTALERYGTLVKQKLVSSRETTGARKFLEKLPEKSMKYVISGGNQDEVRDVFRVKGLERYFTGIFGSPEDKITIIHDKLKSKDIQLPAIFIVDSR
jgi:beta-phosphoglucomutase-like phosphatase (HAD superfamily)